MDSYIVLRIAYVGKGKDYSATRLRTGLEFGGASRHPTTENENSE